MVSGDERSLSEENVHKTADKSVVVGTVTSCIIRLCRMAGLIAPRATLLTVKEQQQALLLSLARKNKEVSMVYGCVVGIF